MQTYIDGASSNALDLEVGLIVAVRANPVIYWETLDLRSANEENDLYLRIVQQVLEALATERWTTR